MMSKLGNLAQRYAAMATGQRPRPAAPAYRGSAGPQPANEFPGTTAKTGQMRFNPKAQLNPSQVLDRRNVPYVPLPPPTPSTGTTMPGGLAQLLQMFQAMIDASQPQSRPLRTRRG